MAQVGLEIACQLLDGHCPPGQHGLFSAANAARAAGGAELPPEGRLLLQGACLLQNLYNFSVVRVQDDSSLRTLYAALHR